MLKKGITGFESAQLISYEEIKTFLKGFSYPMIPDTTKILPPQVSSNYWRIPFVNKQSNQEFDLLINSVYWLLALISKDSTWMNHEFLSFPDELAQQIQRADNQKIIMSPEFLHQPINQHELSQLGQTEIEQITYWKSKTIGDVVFNGYD